MKIILFILLITISSFPVNAQAITVGPTIHCYFPKGKPKLAFGIEATYHHFFNSASVIPGAVLGFETGKNLRFVYGEVQLSRSVNDTSFEGLAIGIFRRITKEDEALTGFQTTVWKTIYFAGGEIRMRFADSYIDGGIGTFVKLPIPLVKVNHM